MYCQGRNRVGTNKVFCGSVLIVMGDCSTKTIKLHQGKTEQLQWSVQRSGVPDTGCNSMIAEAECQLV